jgi:muconolactone delta-isomerase
MKFLALEVESHPVNWSEVSADLMKAEARQAYDLQQAGYIREIHFRVDNHRAIIEWECDSVDQAKTLTATLPLVAAGLIHFEIVQLIPYPGFKRLFADQI